MYATPRRPVKRRLSFTTPRPLKRGRTASAAVFNSVNRRNVSGPSRTGTLTQQVKSLQRVVASLSPELKTIEINTNVTNITTAGSIQHVTEIAQGTDVGNRIGNSIVLKEMYMQTQFTISSDASTSASWRIAIVRDMQQISDTAPAVTDIFSSNNPLIAFPNIANRQRFKFLYLSPIRTGIQTYIGGVNPNIKWDWKGSLKVDYNGSAGTDQQKGAVYIVFLTDATANTMDFVSRVRLMFQDD